MPSTVSRLVHACNFWCHEMRSLSQYYYTYVYIYHYGTCPCCVQYVVCKLEWRSLQIWMTSWWTIYCMLEQYTSWSTSSIWHSSCCSTGGNSWDQDCWWSENPGAAPGWSSKGPSHHNASCAKVSTCQYNFLEILISTIQSINSIWSGFQNGQACAYNREFSASI